MLTVATTTDIGLTSTDIPLMRELPWPSGYEL